MVPFGSPSTLCIIGVRVDCVDQHYLSALNKPPSNNICGFVDFVETADCFYLISEYGGDQNLAEYTKTAHQFISEKRLKLKDWRTVVKFIAWQLAVSLSVLITPWKYEAFLF